MSSTVAEEILQREGAPDLHVRRYRGRSPVRYVLVLVHGTAGHGGCYEEFAQAMAAQGVDVHAPDLRGHGRSGGARGEFSMEGFVDDVDAVAGRAAEDGRPVVLLGASQGGEVAFHAAGRSASVAGAVCMNILLAHHRPLNARMRLIQSRAVGMIADRLGDHMRIPLRSVIDFEAAYREDPQLLRDKLSDPLYVWSYGLRSYRSIFTYVPPTHPLDNRKPVLVAVGEDDPVVGADHCRACAAMIGGPVSTFVMPGAGHQLMQFHRDQFVAVVDQWVEHAVLAGRSEPWVAPPWGPGRTLRTFLADQSSQQRGPEDGYELGVVDRALCRVSNGSVTRGVEFFRAAKYGEFGRFISSVVGRIDEAAWPCFAPHLPTERSKPAMAVLGCGDGAPIEVLRAVEPRLAGWDLVGIDVDGEAIAEAQRKFGDAVELHAIDARELGHRMPGRFDAIYCHGVFDHCAGHRALLESCHDALRPGGAMYYVAPDRNVSTWLRFVAVGPRFAFGLRRYAALHDYRRFPRPPELDRLAAAVGFDVVRDPDAPSRAYHRGVEYRAGPLAIRAAVRGRNLDALGFRITHGRWWLGGGFPGEYLGILRRPSGPTNG